MCGRFSLTSDEQQLNMFFELSGGTAPYVPRYNGAPTQMLPVITNMNPKQWQPYRWGLIPSWSKEIGRVPLINARSETIHQKVSFKYVLKEKRCLVPADGFYEWLHTGRKLPYRFTLKDASLFAFAGLWDYWKKPDGEIIHSFAIITTEANELMEPVHDRMPVILEKQNFNDWLFEKNDESIHKLLKPFPSDKMKKYRVPEAVNKVSAEGAELIIACEPMDLFNGELF